MGAAERRFVLTLSGAHAASHVSRRLLPPLIPVWALAFGYPLWKLGLLAGAFSLGSGLGQTPAGLLSDRYDRRYLLPAGLALVGGAYVAFAAIPGLGLDGVYPPAVGGSTSLEFLLMLATLFVGGLGTSVLHPTGYPLLSENVRPARKGRALGVFGASAKFGDALAPIVVGVLLLVIAWPTMLVVLGSAGIVYAGVLFVALGAYETRPPRYDDDAAEEGGPEGVLSGDRRVYLYPILAIFLYFAVRMIAAGGVNVFIPEFVTSVYGFSLSFLGVTVTPNSVASFYYAALLVTAGSTQLLTGLLVDRFDHRKVLLVFLGSATVLLAVLATTVLTPALLFLVLLGLGGSLWGLNPARDALISDITPAEREGRTFGYLWTGALLVGAVSPVIVGYIGDVAGLQQAFALLAVVTVLSAVPIALLLSPRVYRRRADAGGAASDGAD